MRIATMIALIVVCLSSFVQAQNVKLPDINSEDGLLVRVFIAECINPGYKKIRCRRSKKTMRAMKATIDNRLKNKPEQFGAPKATSYADIVGAAGQFAGFSKNTDGKIVIEASVQKRIDDVMKIANTGMPGKYAAFVQLGIDVAKAAVDDPFKDVKKIDKIETIGGSYGWRTENATSPGGNFVAIPDNQSTH